MQSQYIQELAVTPPEHSETEVTERNIRLAKTSTTRNWKLDAYQD